MMSPKPSVTSLITWRLVSDVTEFGTEEMDRCDMIGTFVNSSCVFSPRSAL